MTTVLPDVASRANVSAPAPLDWVGMEGIDLPVTLAEPDCRREVHARCDAQVDLPAPETRGIHMSRLHRLLDTLTTGDALTPAGLRQLLQDMVDSHRDCKSSSARVRLHFELLARRPALVTPALSGWKSYPVCLDASLRDGIHTLRMQADVPYSSTCPCSAALSRHHIEQAFVEAFDRREPVDPATVAAWLREHATLATPHSQRSVARVNVESRADGTAPGLMALIDRVEQAVGTPLQTAVKRADEQAFAVLNGENPMFVEDAARRIQAALHDCYDDPRVHVRHLESLHPHDAVAWAGPARTDITA